MKTFFKWLARHIKLEHIFTPLAVENIVSGNSSSFVGFTRVYIFGVRVANIQRTYPW